MGGPLEDGRDYCSCCGELKEIDLDQWCDRCRHEPAEAPRCEDAETLQPDETPVQLGNSGLWVPTWARNKMEELDRG